jgi:hypothetical protein
VSAALQCEDEAVLFCRRDTREDAPLFRDVAKRAVVQSLDVVTGNDLWRMPSGCSVCLGDAARNGPHPGDVQFMSSISPLREDL